MSPHIPGIGYEAWIEKGKMIFFQKNGLKYEYVDKSSSKSLN